ncbi:MAG: hypothetical protein ACI4TJ_01765 [Candidatus Cryptobacteroides sp.]
MDKLYKAIPYLIAVLGVISCQQWLEIPVTNQVIDWLCQGAILGIFAWMAFRSRKMPQYRMPWQIVLYLLMALVSALYGLYRSEGYWDYKALVTNFLTFALCLSYFYFAQPSKVAVSLKVWLVASCVVFWVLLPFMQGECIGRFMLPLSFLLILCPLFEKKSFILVLVLSLVVIAFSAGGARSNLLRFLFCMVLGAGLAFRQYIPLPLIKFAVVLEFVLPFVFIVLAVTGTFNIFQIGESLGAGGIEVRNSFDADDTEDLGADTRTFIYLEEFASALNHGYVLQGRSMARGYDSEFFGNEDLEMTGRGERGSSEVAILNVFNYFGVIGVLIYFLLFAGAVVSVFLHSRNKVLYFIAVYVGFRWLWAFVEDFTRFDLNTLCLWAALSMCYSPLFLKMDDRRICLWARKLLRLR